MRLLLSILLAGLAGALTCLAGIYLTGEPLSGDDVFGFASLSFVACVLLCVLLYLPALFWLRRKRGRCQPVSYFLIASALILNLPVAVVFLFCALSGKFFSGLLEVAHFISAFVAAGALFGLGFVSHCRNHAARH